MLSQMVGYFSSLLMALLCVEATPLPDSRESPVMKGAKQRSVLELVGDGKSSY